MANQGEVLITMERLSELEAADAKLAALEAAGVDNWEGYSHAMRILREEEEENAAIDAVTSIKVVTDAEDEGSDDTAADAEDDAYHQTGESEDSDDADDESEE